MYTHTPMCAHSRARTHAPMCTHIAVHTQPCISTHTGTHVTHVHIHTGTGAHVHSKCPPTPEGTHMCTRNALTGHTHPCAGPEFHILQGDRGARPSPTFPGPGLRHWFRAEGPTPFHLVLTKPVTRLPVCCGPDRTRDTERKRAACSVHCLWAPLVHQPHARARRWDPGSAPQVARLPVWQCWHLCSHI